MVFNAAFNNISVISWRSVLSVEETSTQRKPPTCRNSLTNLITKCYIEYTSPRVGFELTPLVVIGTDCTCSCKSNYHTTTTVASTLRKPNRKRLIDWCLAPTLAIHVFKLCRGVNANGKVVRQYMNLLYV